MSKSTLPQGVHIEQQTVLLSQDADVWADERGTQELRIEVLECGSAGEFLVLRTDRWAIDFDEIDVLAEFLKGAQRDRGG